jgi:DNA-directed RNA polymerase beta subunit
MELTPVLIDAPTRRAQIRAKALEGLTRSFPLQMRDRTIELHDPHVVEREFGPAEQKQALLQGSTLHEPVRATLVMKDQTGKELERVKNFTLLHLPYFTERHTFVLDGNEYQVSNQIRMKPGVYTRKRANEELETSFNLSKGSNFRLSLDPRKGHPYLEYGTTTIPLYPVLRHLGVSHDKIVKTWGAGVAEENQRSFIGKETQAIEKLYGKVVHPSKQVAGSVEDKVRAIQAAYENTAMDPEVNQVTLGVAHGKVSPQAILDASAKLLSVYKSGDDVDDRDSLAFKTFHSVDDFIKERVSLDARALAMRVKGRAVTKNTIREIVPAAPFSAGVRSFLTGSQLSAIPTQINPMEMIDHAVKVTSLGEGGISSERAIPMEARQLHPTHLGILDAVRTPESFKAGVDIRASMLTHRDAQGNLYTPVRNVRTGKFEQISAKELAKLVVAFPGQKMTGLVDAMKDGHVQHVPASQVQYEFYHASQFYSPASNLIPMMESIQGNRATMGSKMQTQALPLVDRQVPWVQVGARILGESGKGSVSSFERELGKLVVPTAPVAGKVVKIDHQYIYIDPTGMKKAEEIRNYEIDFTKVAGKVKRQKTVMSPPDSHRIVVKIEWDVGDKRTGVNKKTGETWEKEMFAAYGFIPKTLGDDGETVDVYLKEQGFFAQVFVIHQLKFDGTPDEDKCMIGFSNADEAKKMYLRHVPEWCYGSMSTYAWSDFFDDYLTPRRKQPMQPLAKSKFHKAAAADDSDLIKVPYDTHFPFASKTYLHHNVTVKPGDHVKEDQALGDSNFTRNGELALGRNMKVGYMAYYGLNSNDAVVISEGAAKKLTSEHMYKEVLDVDADIIMRRELHRLYYGAKYTGDQYRRLDAEGVIKKGEIVMPHELIIAVARKGKLSATDALLGNLKKTLANPYREEVRTWDHDFPGEVVDVYKSDRRVVVTIKTQEPMRIGDKLAGRYGNKGVISHIVPDEKMVQDAKGQPIDILYTSAGVISRINPAQIIETAIAKVAEKTGKPIVVENFSGRDNVQWAKDLLKQHGISDKETVFDPMSGKTIPGVLVGPQYTLRLFKTTDSNFSARGTGAYDVNQQPTKGGDEGAKGIGKMEFNALVAHNARNVLHETSVLKSQKNDAFWRAAQLGMPLPPLKSSFAYDKFEHMIQAAGIKIEKKGHTATLRPLTDADVTRMSAGAVQNEKLVKAKNLEPERGGLFDPVTTGGPTGTKWSHIELAEPILNPVFFEPARRLLGLTNKALEEMHANEGGAGVKTRLNQIDVDARLAQLRANMKGLPPSKLDDAVKQIKMLQALRAGGLKAGDAYVLSKLPVLPPVMRPILPGPSGDLVVGDSNYLYQSAILHNNALHTQVTDRALPPQEHAQLRQNLFNAMGAVIGTHDSDNPKLQKRNVKGFIEHLTGKTTPKSSFFQKKLLKRQQDFSGRGTIAPDGSLGMDEVGLPEEMLWGMFSKFVIARLVRRGFPAVQANEMVHKRHPAARDALMAEVAERPVMVNRAPTLHRYNIIGAYAVPVPGKTIRVNAFMEPHMNADYDGDTFQVHTPALPAAVAEVKQMTLSNLIFGDKSKDELLVKPAMEAVMGIHMATQHTAGAAGKVHKYKTKSDALAAYKRGEIQLSDKVEIA